MELVNIEHQISEGEEMSLCPICDNVIMAGEPASIGEAFGVVSLVHEFCVEAE